MLPLYGIEDLGNLVGVYDRERMYIHLDVVCAPSCRFLIVSYIKCCLDLAVVGNL